MFIVYSEWSITSKLTKINPIKYYSSNEQTDTFKQTTDLFTDE